MERGMHIARIAGLAIVTAGAIIAGLWGFPFTFSAMRVNQSLGEAVMSWVGFVAIVAGALCQVIVEIMERR